MCGITGWIDVERDLSAQRATLSAMTATLAPRGPDDAGTWRGPHAALGHRRLAVIDVEGGRQPMAAEHAARVSLEESGQLAARVESVRRARTRLSEGLCAEGLAPLPSYANFVWLPLGAAADRFADAALAAGVRVRACPGDGVRVSVGDAEAHGRVLAAARHFMTGHR